MHIGGGPAKLVTRGAEPSSAGQVVGVASCSPGRNGRQVLQTRRRRTARGRGRGRRGRARGLRAADPGAEHAGHDGQQQDGTDDGDHAPAAARRGRDVVLLGGRSCLLAGPLSISLGATRGHRASNAICSEVGWLVGEQSGVVGSRAVARE